MPGLIRERSPFDLGLASRATAAALDTAAGIADALGRQVGRLTSPNTLSHERLDMATWQSYTGSVVRAVSYARSRGVRVLVVTQPYVSDRHASQQRALAAAMAGRFATDGAVQYVNLGTAVNLQDPNVAYDGLHLVALANRAIAEALLPVLKKISTRPIDHHR
jgi:hypothetical protein